MSSKRVTSEFMKTRLTMTNIGEYLRQNYDFGFTLHQVARKQIFAPIFLQENYGKDSDCTLTSILTMVKYLRKELDTHEIYNQIEKTAKKYLYNGATYGTIPFSHRTIAQKVFNHFNINHQFKTKYLKNVGFDLWDILKEIDAGNMVMLSMQNDGRDYYRSHTVTVIGYVEFCDELGHLIYLLQVYDNWNSSYSFLDFETISTLSEIVY